MVTTVFVASVGVEYKRLDVNGKGIMVAGLNHHKNAIEGEALLVHWQSVGSYLRLRLRVVGRCQ